MSTLTYSRTYRLPAEIDRKTSEQLAIIGLLEALANLGYMPENEEAFEEAFKNLEAPEAPGKSTLFATLSEIASEQGVRYAYEGGDARWFTVTIVE